MPHRLFARAGRLPAPLGHAGSFLAMTGVVAYGDLVTKWVAVRLWSGETHPLVGRVIAIEVVHNTLGAFSMSVGRLTWEINVAATLVAVLLAMAVCGRLAQLDAAAPATLGLVAGAGVGNLASLVGSPAGVPDFLALAAGDGRTYVLNVADVAAYLGIVCCVRLTWTVAKAAVARRTPLELGPDAPE